MSWSPDKPKKYPDRSREGEWLASGILLAFATALLLPGPTFSRPVFVGMAAIAPETTWGVALLAVAVVRMLGLVINGSWRPSPMLRFFGAVIGAATCFTFSALFSDDGYPGLNTGCLVYALVGTYDVYAALRSLLDQSRNDKLAALAKRRGNA